MIHLIHPQHSNGCPREFHIQRYVHKNVFKFLFDLRLKVYDIEREMMRRDVE